MPNFFMVFPIFPFQKTYESLVFMPNRKASFKTKRKSNPIFTLKRNVDSGEHKAISWNIPQLLNVKWPYIGFCGNVWRICPPIKYADACAFVLSRSKVIIIPVFTFS